MLRSPLALNTLSTLMASQTAAAGSLGGRDATALTTQSAVPMPTQPSASASHRAAPATPVSFKTQTAQRKLDTLQTKAATDLRAALAKAGVKLTASVEFSKGGDGKLVIVGNAKDVAAVKAALKADPSSPSFTTRLTELVDNADALASTMRQSSALSQAARYARSSSNVQALYTAYRQQQQAAAPAVMTLSATTSALNYAAVVNTKA